MRDQERSRRQHRPFLTETEMSGYSAIIRIRNLRLRTFIGFNPEERTKQQDIVVKVEIQHTVNAAALQDDVSKALDYKVITKAIIRHVEEGRFLLLEICTRDPAVQRAFSTFDKPHALRFAGSVSLTLECDKRENNPHSEEVHEQHPLTLSKAS